MDIFWTGDIDRPEAAVEHTKEALSKSLAFNAKIRPMKRKPIIIGNPADIYDAEAFKSFGLCTEIHTEHDVSTVDKKFWSNARIEGSVGVLSGFGADVSLQIAAAARVRKLPSGAKGFSVLFINGPNLNLLGTREPKIYGNQTLTAIFGGMRVRHPDLEIEAIQSNFEGEIVNAIQEARDKFDAIVINAGAYTHTSIAIHDALRNFDDIIIEVHISNPHQREEFRHRSYISPVAHGLIAGFGPKCYELALMGIVSKL